MSYSNMMREVRQGQAEAAAPELRRLYEAAFPEEEQIPYDDMLALMSTMPLAYSAWYDGEGLVGLTIVCEWPSACWFWYFAVSEERRGHGCGSAMLAAILSRYRNRPLVLDVESPRQECANMEQRRRRYAFYQRSGLRDTGIERSFGGVTYAILASANTQFTEDDYNHLIAELSRFWDALPGRG